MFPSMAKGIISILMYNTSTHTHSHTGSPGVIKVKQIAFHYKSVFIISQLPNRWVRYDLKFPVPLPSRMAFSISDELDSEEMSVGKVHHMGRVIAS